MPIYVYECDSKHRAEHLCKIAERDTPHTCQECAGEMRRVLTTVQFKLEGITGDFPTAYDKWDKVHREKLSQEQKLAAENGD
jgi:putative FmdB family regulatory protein